MRITLIAAGILIAGSAFAAEIGDLNISDDSNTARFSENQSPASLNDGARALEGLIARWDRDTDCSLVSTGTSTALSVSATRTLTAYYDGLKLCFESHTDNSGATTLNVDSLGAANLLDESGSALPAGALANQMKVEVVYDGTAFRILSPVASDTPDEIITAQGDLIRGDSSGDAQRLALGNPDQVLTVTGGQAAWGNLPVASTTVSGMQENADQADMESEATTRTVTPDQVVQSPYVAKAWVHVLMSGSNISTITGENVVTVVDNGTGEFQVEWDTNFSSANYACAGLIVDATGIILRSGSITAGGVDVTTFTAGSGNADPDSWSLVCFGDR